MPNHRKRRKLECILCHRTFDSDYLTRHNRKYHAGRLKKHQHIPYKNAGAPANPLKESSAEGLFNTLQEILKESSPSLKDAVGQSYGLRCGTGEDKGVKTLVQQVNPQSIFIWTFVHVLNLVTMEACGSSLAAKSLFGALEKLYAFFSQSRKRSDILEAGPILVCSIAHFVQY